MSAFHPLRTFSQCATSLGMRAMKITTIIVAGFAALTLARVIYDHVETVTHLRNAYGITQFPLLPPLLLIPIAGIALAAWFLRTRRNAFALSAATMSLVLSLVFLASQGAGRAGV